MSVAPPCFDYGPGMPGTFSPPPRISDPDMHHGTCVTHVPWCMPGSLTSDFLWSRRRGNVPGIPGACATCNVTYLVRSSCVDNLECFLYRYGIIRNVFGHLRLQKILLRRDTIVHNFRRYVAKCLDTSNIKIFYIADEIKWFSWMKISVSLF